MSKPNHTQEKDMDVTSKNFPAAYAAMDAEAKGYWAYPDCEWQENFLRGWAESTGDEALLRAIAKAEGGAA